MECNWSKNKSHKVMLVTLIFKYLKWPNIFYQLSPSVSQMYGVLHQWNFLEEFKNQQI